MSALLALKQRIAEVTSAPAVPGGLSGVPTGIAALDRALAGGVPRGRLTEITGPRGGGKTTLVRHAVATSVASGLWTAYVDATRTLVPSDWASVDSEALWIVRPADPGRGAWCVDVLLRSGAFGLVVLDGAPPLTRSVTTRLAQLARESDAALVTLGEDATIPVGAAVRLRVANRTVIVEKGGGSTNHHASIEVPGETGVARRLYTHPEVPDRRGVARARGRGRATRCAEPAVLPTLG